METEEETEVLSRDRTLKSMPIILCCNKRDTDTAVKEEKKKEMAGAKGQIQVLQLSLVIQGNPAFNKNKVLEEREEAPQ